MNILIIEDNMDSANMISRVLTKYGHKVTSRHNGITGIKWAREQRPDVVICDLGLPDGITGYDVARTLSEGEFTSSIRLIALSGYGEPEVKKRCLDMGFQIHLTKPVNVAELIEVIASGSLSTA